VTDDSDESRRAAAPRRASTGVPRWVKVFLVIGVVLVVALVVMLAAGHRPGRHVSALGPPPGWAPCTVGQP
jgi:hypothetical protein